MATETIAEERRPTRYSIGSTRTIATAVLVVEYLRRRHGAPHSKIHPDAFSYVFKEPNPANGWWSADIIVTTYNHECDPQLDKDINQAVDLCRAFVAGAGEIWA
jgi:hypothetical protein